MDEELEAVRRPLMALFRLGASRRVQDRLARAAGVDLSPPRIALLGALVDAGPSSLGELAEATDMDPGAASRQVKALERAGLIERGGRDGDARVQELSVTATGRRIRRRLAEVQDRHMADVLDGWSSEDRTELARLLGRFVEDLRAVSYRPEPVEHRSA